MKTSVRALTEGAMVSAIYGFILLLDRVLANNIATTVPFLLPIPLAVYGYKHGFKKSLIVFASMLVLSFLFANPLIYIILLSALISGLVVGYGFHRPFKDTRLLIFLVFIVSIIENILVYFVFSALLGVDLYQETIEMVKIVESMTGIVMQMALIKNVMFISLISVSLFSAIFIVYGSHIVIIRLNKHVPKIPPIVTIQLPQSLIYLLTLLIIANLIPISLPSLARDVLHFLSLTAMFILTLQGYFSGLTLATLARKRFIGFIVWLSPFIGLLMGLPVFIGVCFGLMITACIDCMFPLRIMLVKRYMKH